MSKQMTLGQLREKTKDLPDDTIIELFNDASEWYGVERVGEHSVAIIDGRVVISVDNNYDEMDDLSDEYKRQRILNDHFLEG